MRRWASYRHAYDCCLQFWGLMLADERHDPGPWAKARMHVSCYRHQSEIARFSLQPCLAFSRSHAHVSRAHLACCLRFDRPQPTGPPANAMAEVVKSDLFRRCTFRGRRFIGAKVAECASQVEFWYDSNRFPTGSNFYLCFLILSMIWAETIDGIYHLVPSRRPSLNMGPRLPCRWKEGSDRLPRQEVDLSTARITRKQVDGATSSLVSTNEWN